MTISQVKTATYLYKGEKFIVRREAECEIVVSDNKNSVHISVRGSRFYVDSITVSTGWTLRSPEEALPYACEDLIQKRMFPSSEDACKAFDKLIDSLDGA